MQLILKFKLQFTRTFNSLEGAVHFKRQARLVI